MIKRLTCLLVLAAAVLSANAASSRDPSNLIVHEWGTFTSIAGGRGEPIEWWTAGAVQDLPCFVHRFTMPKASSAGTIRMETPVLYFYSPQETSVDVEVRFRQGLITEWFPRARVAPNALGPGGFAAAGFTHTLEWRGVKISPAMPEDYPTEPGPNHYYAARSTDAAALQVGSDREKFLFYRGVGRFSVPIAATIDAAGKVVVRNTGEDALATVILFENRGGRTGYRLRTGLEGEVALAPPSLDRDLPKLTADLERTLIANGLHAKEARAMVNTWRDSWFEEGTRVFYIVPPPLIDAVLPLKIVPRPAQVTRVFVGRVELITPAMKNDVAKAIETRPADAAKYGRFLPAIVDSLFPDKHDEARRTAAHRALQPAYSSMTTRTCTQPAGTAASSR